MYPQENVPLSPFTTLGIGGPARWFAEAAGEDDVAAAAQWAADKNMPVFVLGGGSNLLVSDAGFNGLVLRVELRGIEVCSLDLHSHTSGQALYRAAAGEDWDAFVERTVRDNFAGVECLAGIPGTVGGTPVQNVGAYGQEVAPVIDRVRTFDLVERAFVEFTAAECDFAYRHSRFNSTDRGRYIVTRVDYRLLSGGAPTVRYAGLKSALKDACPDGAQPSLAEVAATVRRIRQAKGMLLTEGDPDCRSAGSFFKNPVVSEEQYRRIAGVASTKPPRFPAGDEYTGSSLVKVPAAWLIEQAGFSRGHALGRAGISSRHTLALVNRGGATAAEILALAGTIADAVEARFGVRLQMEPVLVGF